MSLNYLKDPSSQVPNLATSNDGVDSIVRFYEKGTDEVKNLLKNECSIIYECSTCRSLFRSIINFVSHKRTICRTLQAVLRSEQIEIIREQQQDKDSESGTTRRPAKNNRNLRRFNPASNLAKHIRPVNVRLERANATVEIPTLPRVARQPAITSIVDGKQVVEQLSIEFALKDQIPDNRVALVLPRENSVRYGEMQLRRRRRTQLTNAKTQNESGVRELTVEEIEIVERVPSAIPADFLQLRCEDRRCIEKNQQPFSSLAILAHHLAIQHQLDYAVESLVKDSAAQPFIRCFLCDISPFKRMVDLQAHFNRKHANIRLLHTQSRLEQNNATNDLNRKQSSPTYIRLRSISPIYSEPEKEDNNNAASELGKEEEDKSDIVGKEKRSGGRLPASFFATPSAISTTEEKQQKIAAAFILRDWIRKGGRDSVLNAAKEKGSEKSEDDEDKDSGGEMLSSSKPVQRNLETSAAEMGTIPRNESLADDGLIDEEEARKIDKLLNSRTSAVHEQSNRLSIFSNVDAERDSDNNSETCTPTLLRSPRKRLPARKLIEGSLVQPKRRGNCNPTKISTPNKLSAGQQPKQSPNMEEIKKSLPRKATKPLCNVGAKKPRLDLAVRKQENNEINRETDSPMGDQVGEMRNHSETPQPLPVSDFVLPAAIFNGNSSNPQNNEGLSNLRIGQKGEETLTAASEHLSQTELDGKGPTSSNAVDRSDSDSAPPLLTKEQLPSLTTDRHKESLLVYTPRARRVREDEMRKRVIPGSSRRKQNLNVLGVAAEGDGVAVIGTKVESVGKASEKVAAKQQQQETYRQPSPPPKPKDLTQVPVYLTELQRDLFFKPLKPLFNPSAKADGHWQCGECGEMLKSIKDGRRHMVSHIRVMRIRCSLCDAGAFFCSDMRVHLMYRHCEKLHLAPEDFVAPGNVVPCMSKERSDLLTKLVDPYHPGRVMYTTGKIVSWSNPKAYYPDVKIESNILGPMVPTFVSSSSSPSGSPRKVKSSILASTKKAALNAKREKQAQVKAASEATVAKAPDAAPSGSDQNVQMHEESTLPEEQQQVVHAEEGESTPAEEPTVAANMPLPDHDYQSQRVPEEPMDQNETVVVD